MGEAGSVLGLSADNDTAIMFSTLFVGEADGRVVRPRTADREPLRASYLKRTFPQKSYSLPLWSRLTLEMTSCTFGFYKVNVNSTL